MSLKVESNLRPFDGTGSWTLWFDRVETIASFSKCEDDLEKARYLSVYLEGTALRIFQQLPEASRRSCKAVAQRLREACQPSAQESHALLLKRKWQQGQSLEEPVLCLIFRFKLPTSLSELRTCLSIKRSLLMLLFLLSFGVAFGKESRQMV